MLHSGNASILERATRGHRAWLDPACDDFGLQVMGVTPARSESNHMAVADLLPSCKGAIARPFREGLGIRLHGWRGACPMWRS